VLYDYGVEQAATLPFVLPSSTRALVWPTLLYILLNLYRLPSTILNQVAGTRYETYTSAKVAGILERKGRQHSRLKSRCVRKPGLDIRTAMLLGQSTDFLAWDCASILHKLLSCTSDTGTSSMDRLKYSNLDQLFESLPPFELVSV